METETTARGTKERKILLVILTTFMFMQGILKFMSITVVGVEFGIFRIFLLLTALWCLINVCRKEYQLNALNTNSTILTGVYLCIILFMAFLWIVKGNFANGALYETSVYAEVLLYLICVVLIVGKDKKILEFFINVIKYIGIVLAIYGYFEIITNYSLSCSRYTSAERYIGTEFHGPTSVFYNENDMAAFLLIVCTIIIYQLMQQKETKAILLKMIQLFVVLMPLTITDATLFKFGIFAVIIAECIIAIVFKFVKYKLKIVITFGGTFIILILVKKAIRWVFLHLNILTTHLMASSKSMKRFIEGDNLFTQLNDTGMGTVTIRKNLFFCGFEEVKKYPIFGQGPAGFERTFERNESYLAKTGDIIDPHNYISELWVQYGTVGMLLFVGLCIVLFVLAIRWILKNKEAIVSGNIIVELPLLLIIAFAIATVMPSKFGTSTMNFIGLTLVCVIMSCNQIHATIRKRKNKR